MRHQSRVGLAVRTVQPPKDAHPDLDVLPLRLADLTLRGLGQVAQIAVLDADQVRLAEREVEMEVDQSVQRVVGVGCLGDDSACRRRAAGC